MLDFSKKSILFWILSTGSDWNFKDNGKADRKIRTAAEKD
jgi:hypothetical protein